MQPQLHIHYPTCRVWVDGVRMQPAGQSGQLCTCPRRWRIRRDDTYTDDHVWSVFRLNCDGHYDLFLRADNYTKALSLVEAMVELENAIRS